MKFAFKQAVFAALLVLGANTWAMDLAEAKSNGYLVEQADGFLKPGSGAPDAARSLMSSVNKGRRAEYERIATKTGSSAAEVGRMMAKKIAGSGR